MHILEIVRAGSNESWSKISDAESYGYQVEEKDVKFVSTYHVDTVDLSVTRMFSITIDDNLIWCSPSLDDTVNEITIYGFSLDLYNASNAKGTISGIKYMHITHHILVKAYIIYGDGNEPEEEPTTDDE